MVQLPKSSTTVNKRYNKMFLMWCFYIFGHQYYQRNVEMFIQLPLGWGIILLYFVLVSSILWIISDISLEAWIFRRLGGKGGKEENWKRNNHGSWWAQDCAAMDDSWKNTGYSCKCKSWQESGDTQKSSVYSWYPRSHDVGYVDRSGASKDM